MQGVVLIVAPKAIEKEAEDTLNNLLLVKAGPQNMVSYWAGFAWDKTGQCASEAA